MRILVVEDDEFNRIMLTELISMIYPGIEMDTASNGREALGKISAGRFSLVLSDVDMPDMNGEELVKAIRGDLELETPVIAITAFVMPDVREKLLLSGFTDYLSKPVEMDRLREVINRYIM